MLLLATDILDGKTASLNSLSMANGVSERKGESQVFINPASTFHKLLRIYSRSLVVYIARLAFNVSPVDQLFPNKRLACNAENGLISEPAGQQRSTYILVRKKRGKDRVYISKLKERYLPKRLASLRRQLDFSRLIQFWFEHLSWLASFSVVDHRPSNIANIEIRNISHQQNRQKRNNW